MSEKGAINFRGGADILEALDYLGRERYHQRRISFSKLQCENATRTQFALHSQATAMC